MNNTTICKLCKVPVCSNNFQIHVNGAKHQQLLNIAAKQENREMCGIFVTESVVENEIVQFFANFGYLKSHYLDKQKKFLIVEFDRPQSVENVLKRNIFLEGRKLIIKRRKTRKDGKRKVQGASPHGKEEMKVQVPVMDCDKIIAGLKNLTVDFEDQVIEFLSLIHISAEDSQKKYGMLQNHLYQLLKRMFTQCKLYRFGSTTTGLNWDCSDVDIFCNTNDNQVIPQDQLVKKVRNFMYKDSKFANVFAMPRARIPIVRFVHVPTQLTCDLNFRNMLGVHNSEFISYVWTTDPRLKSLMFIIKFWAKINGYSSGNAKFSNYLLTVMMLFYLQQMHDFPPIYSMLKVVDSNELVDNWNPHFKKNRLELSKIRDVSLKDLLYGFYEFYAHFDFGLYVISPYLGKPILKILFTNLKQLPVQLDFYKNNIREKRTAPLPIDKFFCCVQDPFELNNNIAKGISLKILQMFCTSCKTAMYVLTNNLKKNTLWCLFTEKLSSDNTCDPNNLEIIISVPHQVNLLQRLLKSDNIDESRIRKAWFDFLKSYLKRTLEEVLLLKTSVKDCCSGNEILRVKFKDEFSESKISRKDGQNDVYDNETIIPIKTECSEQTSKCEVVSSVQFECTSGFNVLDLRKKYKPSSESSKNILEDEIQISTQLAKNFTIPQKESSIVKFDITLSCKSNPTEFLVKMHKINSQSNYFERLFGYIGKALTGNLARYVNELETSEISQK
ncbi:speckle targeted PIP5K1A-regulated poly(A) polymerase-like isoform X2 [Agrilus planipennis]|uniref:Speckle targeted PIP5K1A-regulated poly(A) polymerase-like isoform X2 n=1 Tax=Agrilus planipennis TaxID=224129 RepID=A0A1W4W6Z5_AGRPL|nr:speckle targeted PIP5K1A-regulated poly(A) polymerase-like isoform X2 [Agrilus planipennis]